MEVARVERVDAARKMEATGCHQAVSFLTLHHLKGQNGTEDNMLGMKAYLAYDV